ncbi:hypothetical protein BBJ28_00025947 [Nothophytophthora sp. Chile5]|nr:hypothetical protein BBJ28_00025947 [Nothophytophthora sp. Chile5]
MVLFTEAETLRLLDLYVHFRANPRNVTANGVLLKMHARDELTRAMNKSFGREQPWTESQVSVKFKNLRSEYVELRWLASQSGTVVRG